MIEPTLALQTAIRSRLVSLPAITSLVPAAHIRAGSTRPDKLPSIILADGSTEFLGNASGGQYVARVNLDIHIWTINAGIDAAKAIGFAVRNALPDAQGATDAPPSPDCLIDSFKIARAVWPRDPDPRYGHGVLSIEAILRWTV